MNSVLWLLCVLLLRRIVANPENSTTEPEAPDDATQPPDIMEHPNWKLLDQEACGTSNTDRIIGGKNATMGAYPWIARIGYRTSSNGENGQISYRCGGSLINNFYVVTAAHCVTNMPDGLVVHMVRLGEHNIDTNPDCESEQCSEPIQDIEKEEVIFHPAYNVMPFKNDIGIIRLKKAVVFNDFVKPICMPRGELLTKNFVGSIGEVAGWGIYDLVNPKESKLLQTIKLPIIERHRCSSSFRKLNIGEGQLCVGGVVGEDSCGGDSGGPLMKVAALDGPPKYFFIGIVSFGAKRCGETDVPAIYTSISTFMPWILDTIKP